MVAWMILNQVLQGQNLTTLLIVAAITDGITQIAMGIVLGIVKRQIVLITQAARIGVHAQKKVNARDIIKALPSQQYDLI